MEKQSTPHTGTHARHLYPLEAWRVGETTFDTATNFVGETIFALGNGSIGLRGTHEEGYTGPAGTSLEGAYLNGFYESEPIHYPETAYGLARINQFMLNVPNGKCIELFLEDERFDLSRGTLVQYERHVDFRTGVLARTLEWLSPGGRRVAIGSRRLVSFAHKHLFAIQYEVRPLNFSGRIRLVAALDGAVKNIEAGDDPRVGSAVSGPVLQLLDAEQTEQHSALTHRTRNSGFMLVSAVASEVVHDGGGAIALELAREDQRLERRYEMQVEEGQRVTLTKYGAYVTSRDYPEDALLPRARETLREAKAAGFDQLRAEQEQFLAAFWRDADVEIAGDDALQQGMRFNQFHLLQSVGRDGKTSIAAKGVTGEGYEGHYFWDTEIYVLPFFLYTKPEIARKLLDYRYALLDAARARARQMSYPKGALYPWRTIAGEECSAYYPAGTAQYHINADIAYAAMLYWQVTGDDDFMFPNGAEMVLETARIWERMGSYIEQKDGRFCINEVTGPDEYTALVNNNYYTNAMARMHLRFAVELTDLMLKRYPEVLVEVAGRIDMELNELSRWREAAERMYLPYDEALGIHAQDDTFLSRAKWDFARTPADHYPLLLHYHPLVIYRYQVCKQADVVLALFLLSDQFTPEEKRRDFDYYEAVTTHDSSLSTCMFSIIASEIGYHQKAYDFFMKTARMDLDNSHGNTPYGVHTAAMAGSWMAMAHGFAGMRVHQGQARFAPYLPEQWSHYQFQVRLKGCLLRVRVDGEGTRYRLLEGDALAFGHHARAVTLTREAPEATMPHAE